MKTKQVTFEQAKQKTINEVLNSGKPENNHLPFRLAYSVPTVKTFPVYGRFGAFLGNVEIELPKGYIFASHNSRETAEQHLNKVKIHDKLLAEIIEARV